MSKKPYKVRAKNYNQKPAIEGSIKVVTKVPVSKLDKPKEKPANKEKPAKKNEKKDK